jgi:hypothetical protein
MGSCWGDLFATAPAATVDVLGNCDPWTLTKRVMAIVAMETVGRVYTGSAAISRRFFGHGRVMGAVAGAADDGDGRSVSAGCVGGILNYAVRRLPKRQCASVQWSHVLSGDRATLVWI